MLYSEIIAVSSEIHTKHINTLCGQNVEFVCVLPGDSFSAESFVFQSAIPKFNPLNPELNPICYLLALIAHHFLHVSRIRVKS